jgi:hypothetical protein
VRRRWAGAAAALCVAACAPLGQLPDAPVPAGPSILVDVEPVALDRADPARQALGGFVYAGGLALTSRQTSRLHGLSDLKVGDDGAFVAVGDQSDLLEGRIVLDDQGRLAGLTDVRLSALKAPDGTDLYAGGQREFDAEGIVRLASGEMVVAFEQHDRVLVFPVGGGLPRSAPAPAVPMIHNKGAEALMAAPEAGPDAYRIGVEASGELFLCRLSTDCRPDGRIDLQGSELVAIEAVPGVGRAYLFRSFAPLSGNVVQLRIEDAAGRPIDTMELARPLTVDNFEGLGVAARPDGAWRFYLLSDDNFGTFNGRPTGQRTLLLAFDWSPKTKRPPRGAASSNAR